MLVLRRGVVYEETVTMRDEGDLYKVIDSGIRKCGFLPASAVEFPPLLCPSSDKVVRADAPVPLTGVRGVVGIP